MRKVRLEVAVFAPPSVRSSAANAAAMGGARGAECRHGIACRCSCPASYRIDC